MLLSTAVRRVHVPGADVCATEEEGVLRSEARIPN